jgi:starch synthase (maltosyl-transferring)
MSKPLYIYNLFPTLYAGVGAWIETLDAISDMGFNSLYVNPFHLTGASGSVYAVKDYYGFNPNLFPRAETAVQELKDFLNECHRRNLDVFYDLVANHVSIDSPLIREHPDWFSFTHEGEVVRPRTLDGEQWITWEDLAKFNLATSPDREGLWSFLLEICRYFLRIGFAGFRCDAAYHIVPEFWAFLFSHLKTEFPGSVFLAETFMATQEQVRALARSGFDYIFNSAKWWNYSDAWCLEQYNLNKPILATISFPETHDTPRLMAEVNGDTITFLQRLFFTGFFSQGFMLVSGCEFGFRKQLNCVTTTASDWENTGLDFSEQIKRLLATKKRIRPLHEESATTVLSQRNPKVLCLLKESKSERALLVVNKDVKNAQYVRLGTIGKTLQADRICDFSPGERLPGYLDNITGWLAPGEVKVFAGEGQVA